MIEQTRPSRIGKNMRDDLDLRDFNGVTRLFPLAGVVMFPHVVLPLHIFEPRYRQMTRDALAGDRLITIVQAKAQTEWSADAEPELEEVGCMGRILGHEALPDGRFNFLLLGKARVRLIEELNAQTLYRQARVEILEDAPEKGGDRVLKDHLIAQVRAKIQLDSDLSKLIRSDLPLGTLTDLLAHALSLPAPLRQALLVETCPGQRARVLSALLEQVGLSKPLQSGRPFPPPFSLN